MKITDVGTVVVKGTMKEENKEKKNG